MKRVLIACEFSGIVREAFKRKGFDAWSCDLLPTEIPGQHIQGDVLEILNEGWDLMIAHPPCTHLAVSGAVWFEQKRKDGSQHEGIDFFMKLVNSNIPRYAIENPVGVMSTLYRKPNQIVQPYWFGDSFQKATCLWLRNLPKLSATNMVDRGEIYVTKNGKKRGAKWSFYLPSNKDRWKERSRTFPGIAEAMADQWGKELLK